MAIAANTTTKYDMIGIREQLSNIIYNISPEDTPFMSSIKKGKVKQTFYEWQTDALATPDGTNAQLEGDDAPAALAITPTVRLGNTTQISRKVIIVSDTADEVDAAGRDSEESYQLAKRSSELKRDMETILIGTNQGYVAGSTTVARKTGTMLAFVKTNTDYDTGAGANPTYTTTPSGVRTDGTQRAITETMLKNVIQLSWAAGASPSVLMVGPKNKQRVSGFTGIADIRFNAQGNKPTSVIAAVDVYVSDFGNISVVANRFSRERDAWVLDYSYIKLNYLRPFKKVPLAKTGDADKTMLVVEYGLEVGTEKSQAGIFDLTT